MAHAEDAKSPWMEFYGFFKLGPILGQNVESYGNPNSAAITAALNPVFGAADGGNRYLTFQAAQTRFGFKTNKDKAITGQVEMDFMDTTKASPTTASVPRLRMAKLDWRINDNHTLTIGQDWDLFSPIVPHTYNWVGAMFTAGNVGFFRQQIQYKAKVGMFELAAAIGLQGNSNGPSLGDIEHSTTPTFAARVAFDVPKLGRIAVNGIYTQLHVGFRDTPMYAVGAYGDLWLSKTTNLRFEGTYGQNMNNTGMLTLGTGLAGTVGNEIDVREAGGYISLKQTFAEGMHGIWLAAGMSHVLNPEKLPYGYTSAVAGVPAVPGVSPAVAAVAAARTFAANGPGILRNIGYRLGYEFIPVKGLSLFAEGFFYNTWHKLRDGDLAKFDPTNYGFGAEMGVQYFF